jgi:hypothetical protein
MFNIITSRTVFETLVHGTCWRALKNAVWNEYNILQYVYKQQTSVNLMWHKSHFTPMTVYEERSMLDELHCGEYESVLIDSRQSINRVLQSEGG